jgi:hypothetical protein
MPRSVAAVICLAMRVPQRVDEPLAFALNRPPLLRYTGSGIHILPFSDF